MFDFVWFHFRVVFIEHFTTRNEISFPSKHSHDYVQNDRNEITPAMSFISETVTRDWPDTELKKFNFPGNEISCKHPLNMIPKTLVHLYRAERVLETSALKNFISIAI